MAPFLCLEGFQSDEIIWRPGDWGKYITGPRHARWRAAGLTRSPEILNRRSEATSSPLMGHHVRDGPALLQESRMAWILLGIAGILEIVWAFFMKQSDGFTRIVPSAITIVTMIASFALLSISMKTLPLGTAYTVWTGIGAVGAFVVGVAVLGEQISLMRVVAALLIVSGLVMMKLSTTS